MLEIISDIKINVAFICQNEYIVLKYTYDVLTKTQNDYILILGMRDSMESLTLNVRVDANDKKCFEQFCSNVGMNVSTAINMFIKAVLREQKLPFEIKANTLDETIYEKLKEAELEMDNTSKRYTIHDVESSMNSIINRE